MKISTSDAITYLIACILVAINIAVAASMTSESFLKVLYAVGALCWIIIAAHLFKRI